MCCCKASGTNSGIDIKLQKMCLRSIRCVKTIILGISSECAALRCELEGSYRGGM
jgi:hypothetical protein